MAVLGEIKNGMMIVYLMWSMISTKKEILSLRFLLPILSHFENQLTILNKSLNVNILPSVFHIPSETDVFLLRKIHFTVKVP